VRAELHQHRGFSLIEVLVALVIMSVGLLTVAALQVKGLQFERGALNGTRATLLAADLVDRIRANPEGAEFYDIALGDNAPAPEKACADTEGVALTDPCTPEEMAAYDLWEWREAMTGGSSLAIPQGTGAVDFVPGDIDVHRITIRWREDSEDVTYDLDMTNG
jgi:type IV pilus assembly protein PilV